MSKQTALETLAHKLDTTNSFLNDAILNNSAFWSYIKKVTESRATNMAWIQTPKYTFQITVDSGYWKNKKDFVSVQYGLTHGDQGSDHLINTAEVPETIDLQKLEKALPYCCHCNCDTTRDDIEGTANFQIKMLNLFWSKMHSLYSEFLDIELAKEN